MKKMFFRTMTLIVGIMLVFIVIGCDSNSDNDNNNNQDNGNVFTPTSISALTGSIAVVGFKPNLTNSTLPGFVANGEYIRYNTTDSCGFSITLGGSTVPFNRVSANSVMGLEIITTLTTGQTVTLSYSPNGTHIFTDNNGKTLGAFSLSGTVGGL